MIQHGQRGSMDFRNHSNTKDSNIGTSYNEQIGRYITIKLIEVYDQFILCHLHPTHQFLHIRQYQRTLRENKSTLLDCLMDGKTNRFLLLPSSSCLFIVPSFLARGSARASCYRRFLQRERYCLQRSQQKMVMSTIVLKLNHYITAFPIPCLSHHRCVPLQWNLIYSNSSWIRLFSLMQRSCS